MKYSLEKGLFIVGESEISQRKINVPLAVNWNITGNCTNNCCYCYGKDIVGVTLSHDYVKIAENILELSPAAVVFSGGEPLLEKGFDGAVDALYGKAHLILDTNGILIDDNKVKFLKERHFHVRISLDSDVPEINEKNRPSGIENSTFKIKQNIINLLGAGVPVTVQTTVTDVNYGYLGKLGEYLEKTGVKNWRIAAVIPSDGIFKEKITSKFKELAEKFAGMSLRLSNCGGEKDGNGIILFGPCGDCIVRGTLNNDKDMLFGFGCGGLKDKILSVLDYRTHILRYSLTEKA